jgi:nucleoside-diphosphate-sugar epimerase
VVVVNPTRVFGPGLLTEGNSVTLMIKQYLEGSWRLILGTGNAIGNYAYIDDIINGHLLAMEYGINGQRYILGGENLSFNDFFKVLEKQSKHIHKLFKVPSKIALLFSRFEELKANWFNIHPLITPEWVQLFLKDGAYSSARAQLELGYKITPFKEALAETIDWIEKSHLSK